MREKKMISYDDQESRILQQSAGLIELLTKKGAIADTQIRDARVRKAKQNTARKVYHNTEVLLEQYRTIVWILKCIPGEISNELRLQTESIDQILERIDYELTISNKRLEARLKTMIKTRYLLERVNESLEVLKCKPGNGEALYKLIYEAYIDPEERNVLDLVDRLGVSTRTYYRMKEEAISVLSIRLWSAPSREVDDWLEVLSLLEAL